MVNKIMYQKIQHFKRKGFTKADIVRETGVNKWTVWKYYSMAEKKHSRYIEKVRYRTNIFEPYQPHILTLYKVNNFQRLEKSVVYDYLEEKLGSLPGTERSFRNYITYLIETKQLAFEYAPYNININCVCPSQTRTDMIKKLSKNKIIKNIPMHRLAEPKEIAEVVFF